MYYLGQYRPWLEPRLAEYFGVIRLFALCKSTSFHIRLPFSLWKFVPSSNPITLMSLSSTFFFKAPWTPCDQGCVPICFHYHSNYQVGHCFPVHLHGRYRCLRSSHCPCSSQLSWWDLSIIFRELFLYPLASRLHDILHDGASSLVVILVILLYIKWIWAFNIRMSRKILSFSWSDILFAFHAGRGAGTMRSVTVWIAITLPFMR